MPYIVTTKPDACPEGVEHCRCVGHSRRVVATLDELDREIRRDHAVSLTLPESGGTVGPLPDGSVIAVEATTWRLLAFDLGIELRSYDRPRAQQRILDTYNEANA